MIKLQYSQNFLDGYYTLIANSKAHKFKEITFEEYYNKHYKQKIGFALKDLLCGDFEKLTAIKNKHNTKFQKNKSIQKMFNYDKSRTNNFQPLISKLQPKISKYIEENGDIHTCYFCNIDFINPFKVRNTKTKNGFTLDHFLDKATYPFLALSIYNLIPSCYICNSKVKGTSAIKAPSPTSKKFDFDEKVKFKTFVKNENLQIKDDNDFRLLLKEDFSEKYTSYIDTLELNGRYEYYKYKVIEFINKRKLYPDSRIKELADLTHQTQEKVKQDLFGEFLNDKDLHKRPLSKLIKDISEELELI